MDKELRITLQDGSERYYPKDTIRSNHNLIRFLEEEGYQSSEIKKMTFEYVSVESIELPLESIEAYFEETT